MPSWKLDRAGEGETELIVQMFPHPPPGTFLVESSQPPVPISLAGPAGVCLTNACVMALFVD